MKDIVTPVPPEEVRYVIKKCLENAALVNYTRISEFAKIEGTCTASMADVAFTETVRQHSTPPRVPQTKCVVEYSLETKRLTFFRWQYKFV